MSDISIKSLFYRNAQCFFWLTEMQYSWVFRIIKRLTCSGPMSTNVQLLRMQTVSESLINKMLSTVILSDTLKIMIYQYWKRIDRSLSMISNILETSLGRQLYLHTSMIDSEYSFERTHNCTIMF